MLRRAPGARSQAMCRAMSLTPTEGTGADGAVRVGGDVADRHDVLNSDREPEKTRIDPDSLYDIRRN